MNTKIKSFLSLGLMLFGANALCAPESAVVYFSKYENSPTSKVDSVSQASFHPAAKKGSTAFVAQAIAQQTGSDLYSIRTEKSYPASFDETISANHQEQTSGELQKLTGTPDLSKYQIIYLGFPIWNMALPQAVQSFIRTARLEGKTVIPFCTHDGYGAGSSFNVISRTLEKSTVQTNGLQVASSSISQAPAEITSWLKQMAPVFPTINCKVGGNTIRIKMNNTPEAKEFLSKLPLTVNMGEFGGREFYGAMPGSIDAVSKGQYTFKDGTLTYCPTNNTVAIFYAQSSRPNLTMAVYPMGQVVSDLSVFGKLNSYESFRFSK